MSDINNLNEAILNIGQIQNNQYGDANTNEILYSRWKHRYSQTIGDFNYDFIEPRLPKPEIILEWHKMLMEYCEMDKAIFPIRDGHTNAEDDKIKPGSDRCCALRPVKRNLTDIQSAVRTHLYGTNPARNN